MVNITQAVAVPHRYEALDGLRGICAIFVCLFHFRANGPLATLDFVRGSWLFVDFFFVLSGFVIAANYRESLVAGKFLRRFVILRLGRLYPLHAFMLLCFVVVELAAAAFAGDGVMRRQAFDSGHSVYAILTNLTLTQAFGLHPRLTWNQPSWSIAVEFWTYLLFALAALWAGAGLEKWLGLAVIVCAAVLMMVTNYGINVSHAWSIFRCVYGFAVGALLWRLCQHGGVVPRRAWRGATFFELAAVVAVVVFVSLFSATRFNLLSPLVFGGAIVVFAAESGAISRWLTTAPFRWLGVLSYSIYMVHSFVQSWADDLLRLVGKLVGVRLLAQTTLPNGLNRELVGATPLMGVIFTLLMLLVVIGVSQLTWRYVEIPGQRWSRRLAMRDHEASGVSA